MCCADGRAFRQSDSYLNTVATYVPTDRTCIFVLMDSHLTVLFLHVSGCTQKAVKREVEVDNWINKYDSEMDSQQVRMYMEPV